MTATTAPPLHARASFPWYVLLGAIVLQGATAPGQTIGISVFVDHITADLDLSRSAVSSAYLVGTLSGALTMPAAGRLIDRRGVRTATLFFGAGFGSVLIATAGVAGFITLAIGFAGTRILGQGALTLTATTTVAVWFDERRGLASGIKSAAGSGLMALVPIGSAALIAVVGWRSAWIVLGLGASGAAIRTIEATALPRWFGISTIGQIKGIVMAAGVGASAIGPLIVSLGHDLLSSYTPVLNALGVISLGLATVTLFVKPPSETPDRAVPAPTP